MQATRDRQDERAIRSIVIVGGGSAGWMTAAALANSLQQGCAITLVESEEIGIVGVGEATIPTIRLFNDMLGIDEAEFIRATHGSFKLGIQFVDWSAPGARYFHPFGSYGKAFDTVAFHQFWLAARHTQGIDNLDHYCMAWTLAEAGKFAPPSRDPRTVLSTYDYAYHFDAARYAAFLRRYAEAKGVTRLEGKVASVTQHGDTGFVESVTLTDERVVTGDLFIDCSGFAGLLIEKTLRTGYEEWSHWLPCDRAVAVPSAPTADILPYTRSTARNAGWQWRIPVQGRIGNGYVYASRFIDDDTATRDLLRSLDGKALADPRPLRFTTGRRRQAWNRNVIAIGLSSGFLEPLESTGLHLIQANISKLLAFFPDKDFDPLVIAEFNHVAATETERIRDFLVLHYHLTTRDEPLWRHTATMPIPDTLATRIDHFRRYGRLISRDMDLFGPASWTAVHIGQGNLPRACDPLKTYRTADGVQWLTRFRNAMQAEAAQVSSHRAYIETHCAARESTAVVGV